MSDEPGWSDFDDPTPFAPHELPEPFDGAVHDDVFGVPDEPDEFLADDVVDHQPDITPVDAPPDLPASEPDEPAAATVTPVLGPIGADPDAAADSGPPPDLFPPAVDVGPLPEPIDGFPWTDTGSLGLAALTPTAEPVAPVTPQELAEYAAEELPPAVDPWAALADSDDPATAALARWWSTNG
ncbi:hypothetical protein [Actinoplanes sp. NPDC051859]|uniref:hypothetical protein n=1 Tax=Actinoplanes sp. NPDC051859 TaxID=3363909 RepID=UPI003792E9AE